MLYWYIVPNGTTGGGGLSLSTDILSLTGQPRLSVIFIEEVILFMFLSFASYKKVFFIAEKNIEAGKAAVDAGNILLKVDFGFIA